MKNQFDLTKIAGTLKRGKFYGEKRKAAIIAYVCFASFMLFGMIAMTVAIFIEPAFDSMSAVEIVFVILGLIVGFLLVPILLLVVIIKNEKLRKEILLWLEDAVELGAYCETLSVDYGRYVLNQALSLPVSAKVRVRFKYNGKHYTRDSGYKNKKGELKNDFQSIWVDYADKSVNILYSPKYDQVIVLK